MIPSTGWPARAARMLGQRDAPFFGLVITGSAAHEMRIYPLVYDGMGYSPENVSCGRKRMLEAFRVPVGRWPPGFDLRAAEPVGIISPP